MDSVLLGYHDFRTAGNLKLAGPRGRFEENLGMNLERHRPAKPPTRARYLILGMAAGLLAVTIACGNAATTVPPTAVPPTIQTEIPDPVSTPIAGPTEIPLETPVVLRPIVRVDDLEFPVELAAEPELRIRGLSGRASLDSGTGMLFVFENSERFRFWMREMQFSLDIVWISSGCEVVDISVDVPFPDPSTPLSDLPRYSPESSAKYVLEINGGEAEDLGLGVGDPVEFLGELDGLYGC